MVWNVWNALAWLLDVHFQSFSAGQDAKMIKDGQESLLNLMVTVTWFQLLFGMQNCGVPENQEVAGWSAPDPVEGPNTFTKFTG